MHGPRFWASLVSMHVCMECCLNTEALPSAAFSEGLGCIGICQETIHCLATYACVVFKGLLDILGCRAGSQFDRLAANRLTLHAGVRMLLLL